MPRLLALLVVAAAAGIGCQFVSPDPDLRYRCEDAADCEGIPGGGERGFQCVAAPDSGGVKVCVPVTECATCESLGFGCGEWDDGCGGKISCGTCGAGLGCGAGGAQGLCAACQSTDEPDDLFLDADCDGIDGREASSIFVDAVSGNDASPPGTKAAPFRTIGRALQQARQEPTRAQILVSRGVYAESLRAVGASARIHGGYAADQQWRRSADNAVTVVADSPTGHLVADAGSFVLDLVTLESPSAAADAGFGTASVGLYVHDVSGLSFRRGRIVAGSGAPGADGPVGASGTPGAAGTNGAASSGGGGGAATACDWTSEGGRGGNGTAGAGGSGSTPVDGGAGGGGGALGDCGCIGPCVDAQAGGDGQPGGAGSAGVAGVQGAREGTFSAAGYVPPQGGSGSRGTSGRGGGGGGAGGAYLFGCALVANGRGGGGGGSGGCGGEGGGGGFGGGPSVALLVERANVSALSTTLVTSTGGPGGAGSAGGEGGPGGPGGAGSPSASGSGRGGDGGSGGAGGPGGPGAGGGGGASVGVWCVGGRFGSADGGVGTFDGFAFQVGQGGEGGPSPGTPGPTGRSLQHLGCE